MSSPLDKWQDYEDATRGQAEAAQPEVSAWVEANAGSGKTKVLIDRVARLLLRHAEPDTILCVTYTKAAASEMQSRLFRTLGDWCVRPAEKLKADLAELEGRNPKDYTLEEISHARELFAKALETPGGLRIETIHAFCGRLLRRFPLEAGIAPGFSELDEDDASDLWDQAFRAMGRRVLHGERQLIEAARTVAEAGGGKGFDSVRQLLSKRGAIERFITGAGGIDAAEQRLRILLGAGTQPAAKLIDAAMGAELPREKLKALYGAMPGAKKNDEKLRDTLAIVLSEADADERHTAYRKLCFTGGGDVRKANPYTADAIKSAPGVAALFQIKDAPQGSEILRILALEETLRTQRIYERSAALLRLAHVLFADFERRKRNHAGLDFDDLIETAGRLLTLQHAAQWVLWKLDGGISHILLDEAQDTSPPQWTILKALTDDIFGGAGAPRDQQRTLFVVGDQKQSIYSFQGADPEHFLDQTQLFESRARLTGIAFTQPALAMSFRSAPEILSYVDEVFDTDAFDGQAPFTIRPPNAADLLRHTPYRRHESGSVELWPLEQKTKAEPAEPWDAPRGQEKVESPKATLARRIAQFIANEVRTGAAVWDGKEKRPARPGDFLILVRGRKGGLFDGILQALKRENLPVAGADRIQLLDSLAVQDLLNLVRFALCPEDDLTLAEILKGPFGGLNDDELFALAHPRAKYAPLWPELAKSADKKVVAVRGFLADVLARKGQPPFEFLTHALERGHGLARPGWELILSRFGGPAREPVTALIDRAAAFDAEGPPSLELFLSAVEARGGEVKRELSGKSDLDGEVRVMTVHGAKGLESPVVILPDTCAGPKSVEGLFVSKDGAPVWAGAEENDVMLSAELRADATARALREHRRLLYVALTRAQDRLIVCGAAAGNSKAGHAETAWYAVCADAMARLDAKGAVTRIETDGRIVLRLGDAPELLLPEVMHAKAPAVLPAWLRAAAPVERAPRVLAPSAIGAKSEPPVMTPFGGGREAKLRRGRLIHLLFEALPDVAVAERRAAAARYLARHAELTPGEQAEMIDATMRVLEDPRFAAVFAPGGRAEAPVIGKLGGSLIAGRVDRLVIAPDEVLIVDYKTDRPAPPSVAEVGEAYIAQMGAYRALLSQTWPNRTIRCLLVWTDGPKLMEIPPADLDRVISGVNL